MPPISHNPSLPNPRVPLILVGNVFLIIDDGAAVASDYPIMARMVVNESLRCSTGLACITVIPASSRPPSEEIRRAIRETFTAVTKHLASVCWMVEGSGFKAGATRAALAGLRLLIRPPYPTHITSDLRDAFIWSRAQVGTTENVDLDRILRRVHDLREGFERPALDPVADPF